MRFRWTSLLWKTGYALAAPVDNYDSAGVPPTERSPTPPSSAEATVERLRAKLVETLEGASSRPRNAVVFVSHLVRRWGALKETRRTLELDRDPRDAALEARALYVAYLREREELLNAPGRLGLLRVWNDLLVETAQEIERERPERDERQRQLRTAFEKAVREAPQADDSFASATARAAAPRWRDA